MATNSPRFRIDPALLEEDELQYEESIRELVIQPEKAFH